MDQTGCLRSGLVLITISCGASPLSTDFTYTRASLIQDNDLLPQTAQQPCHCEAALTWKMARGKWLSLRAPFRRSSSALSISLQVGVACHLQDKSSQPSRWPPDRVTQLRHRLLHPVTVAYRCLQMVLHDTFSGTATNTK